MKFIKNKYIRFAIVAVTYILWTIWVKNLWLLLGLPIIYDMYVSKKVNWTFWKKKEGKNSTVIEWLDALIFAVVAVTMINIFLFQNYKIPTGSMEKSLRIGDFLFVSKVSYGPRIPNTPIAFPFTQHTLPLTKSTPSFINWPNWGYKRIAGLGKVKNNDPVVFNFPEGDTVIIERSTESYYGILRNETRNIINRERANGNTLKEYSYYENIARKEIYKTYKKTKIVSRPVDRRDNYIKRCVAIPGDKLEIIDGIVYINGKINDLPEKLQHIYNIQTTGKKFSRSKLNEMGIYRDDIKDYGNGMYQIPLTIEILDVLKRYSYVKSIDRYITPKNIYDPSIFPHSPDYPWTLDNFGPLTLPKRGIKVDLNMKNIALYKRVIDPYEGNKLEIKDSTIYINGEIATSYTFKMDYYFMIGDNRHMSLDSRYWGMVPEDHIVGKPLFIWLSLDKEGSFPGNIRWNRMFRKAY